MTDPQKTATGPLTELVKSFAKTAREAEAQIRQRDARIIDLEGENQRLRERLDAGAKSPMESTPTPQS